MNNKKILDTARNASLNNALASGSAMVSESTSGCSSRRNIETIDLSVILNLFQDLKQNASHQQRSNKQCQHSKYKRKEFFMTCKNVICNGSQTLKQVQGDGISHVKEANLTCPPLEGGPEFSIPRRGSERSELLTPHQGRLACTTTLETAKEVRSTSSCSFAPWGEGDRRSDEGSYKLDATGMTPHQGRPACTNTLETAKGGQQSLHSFAPWGEGRDEGADKSALTQGATAKDTHDSFRHPELVSGSSQAASFEDMTPHQVRTKLAKRSLSPTILSPSGEELRDVTRHSATEPKNVKDLTSYRLIVLTS